ncbi:MAG: hypothetical protein P8Y23_12430, partial [Candidatus Lokiarchaeota archaeon]
PYKNKNLSNAIYSYLNTTKSRKLTKGELKQYLASINFIDTKLNRYGYEDFIVLSEKFYEFLGKTGKIHDSAPK